jgi:hypothetical protein
MRGEAHILLAAGDDDVGVAGLDLLSAESDCAKSGAANLVHAPGGRLDGDASGDGGLPRWVLPLASGQNLTHDHFIDIRRRDVCAIERSADGDLAERVRWDARKRAVERANRRSRRADDDNILVFHSVLHFPNISKVIP